MGHNNIYNVNMPKGEDPGSLGSNFIKYIETADRYNTANGKKEFKHFSFK
jgi:hypothetical protein